MFKLNKDSLVVLTLAYLLNFGVAYFLGYEQCISAYTNGVQSPTYTLLTTHFTHHNIAHLINNMLALWLLLVLFPNKVLMVFCSFTLCILLVAAYVILNHIEAFLGFSALLYCLPGGYLFKSIISRSHNITVGILTFFYTYTFIITPMTINNNHTWLPMTDAHILGFASGFLTAYLHSKLNASQPQLPKTDYSTDYEQQ